MAERTGDTRERIKAIALELFTSQGYEQTSLREIAERLGVTKAALYYHFKSKDEIVQAFVADRLVLLDELVEWARSLPPGPATRRAFVRRYAQHLAGHQGATLVRFFEQNRAAFQDTEVSEQMRQRMHTIVELLSGEHPRPAQRLRTACALLVLHGARHLLQDTGTSDADSHAAALEVALQLADADDGKELADDAPARRGPIGARDGEPGR